MKKEAEEFLYKISVYVSGSGKFTPEECVLWKSVKETLSAVESAVIHGGFIQDRKGNICRAGDMIILKFGDYELQGVLSWDKRNCAFKVNLGSGDSVFLWCFKGNWEKKEL